MRSTFGVVGSTDGADMWSVMLDRRTSADPGSLAAELEEIVALAVRDGGLMEASARWLPGRPDPTSYVPGDVAALRLIPIGSDLLRVRTLLDALARHDTLGLSGAEQARLLAAARDIMVSLGIYQAKPFFLPAPIALAAVGTEAPPPGLVDDLRLPFEAVWVVLGADFALPGPPTWPDGVDLTLDEPQGLAGGWRSSVGGALGERGSSVDGVVLFAGDDGLGLADEVIWSVSAAPDPSRPAPLDLDRQRGRIPGFRSLAELAPVAENLALVVASASWHDPPAELPGIGRPGSERWRRSLGRASARRAIAAGAGSGVRVVDMRRTLVAASEHRVAGEAGRAVSPHARRGHWRRSRVAIRDAAGRIVGDGVHGVHGVDWRYVPHWILPVWVGERTAQSAVQQVWRLPSPPRFGAGGTGHLDAPARANRSDSSPKGLQQG